MANPTYKSGTATVSTTATLLVTVASENDGILIHNGGSVIVYLGGPGVSAANGMPIPASSTQLVPSVAGVYTDLWAVAASTTAAVSWLQP